jgi:Flp pilus assembly protein TadB
MSRKQVEKNFEELYVSKNRETLVEEYYKKKKRDMGLLVLAGTAVIVLLLIREMCSGTIAEGETLSRNEYGQGKKEVELEVKTEEAGWQDITLALMEREYTEEELEESAAELIEALPDIILGENASLDRVTRLLNLPEEEEGYPFLLSWQSSEPEVLDSTGDLGEGIPREGQIVQLTVVMSNGEWALEHGFFVRVFPEEEEDGSSFITSLSEQLKEQEAKERQNSQFSLPDSMENISLVWRYKRSTAALWLAGIFLLLLPVVWQEKDRDLARQVKNRREELQKQYPGLVEKLILLMEAGMSIKGALFRISEDYQKKKQQGKREECLYEEISFVCRQMNNGMSEQTGYELLGKRCQLPVYKKLGSLFVQQLQKGSLGLQDALHQEAERANEERKNQIKKQGEEAGTKLLFPMMLMLGMVMLLIMVPAGLSFRG